MDEIPDGIVDNHWFMILDFIDPDGWASIVASVSKGSELNDRFFAFRKLHDSVGEIKLEEKTK